MQNKVSLISLGCEKNQVDSEMILGLLKKMNLKFVSEEEDADLLIINTCGFIESAKKEAIDTIIEALEYKKRGTKIIVCGCLVQRYLDELKESISEVDAFIPIRDYYKFGDVVSDVLGLTKDRQCIALEMNDRFLISPPYLAYVRIADGCNNRCTYCAIPLIRGNLKSREEDEIVSEVEGLVKKGVLEICLISQDLSNYGYDINTTLAHLLKRLVKIEGLKWLRLLYLYPDEITDEFISVVRDSDKILKYFDIPLQHASNKILKYMHRRGSKEDAISLIGKIRKEIPDAVIRTTMIVGFPHESEKDFDELMDFVRLMHFEHMGAFTYSKEEDTISYNMTMQVSKKVKEERLDTLMKEQRWISLENNEKCVGKEYEVLIESYNHSDNTFNGRSYAFAPDDIDGCIIVHNNLGHTENILGTILKVKITKASIYDLEAIFVK